MPNETAAPAVVQNIPVEKIVPSPYQARKSFDEEALKELADSMKSEGLIQPIIVRAANSEQPAGSSYELIAGERRLRAAKLLGWTTIDAIVQAGVNDQDAAMRGLIENLLRSDLNPIERAQGYKQLEDMGLNQESIGAKMGIGQTTVARYLALLDLPEPIQELMPRGILSEGHTRSIRQIPTLSDQIQVAQQADKEGWSVKETEKRVKEFLGKKPKAEHSEQRAANSSHLSSARSALPDPLADLWPSLQTDVGLSVQAYWEVKYGVHKPDAKALPMNGWFFFVQPREPENATAELTAWLKQLANALEGRNRESVIGNGATATPGTDMLNPRLPQTPQEQAELEDIATKQGPRAVYAWIYGADSPMTKAVPAARWEDMGMTPSEGLRKVLEGIRQFEGASA